MSSKQAPDAVAVQAVKELQKPGAFKMQTSLLDRNTASVNYETKVKVPHNVLFDLLADPFQHERIFDAIEEADARLIEEQGTMRKWELDYKARWRFWKVSGVCDNRLHMWTDKDKGTVIFKLREPGFLTRYEGSWTIQPDKQEHYVERSSNSGSTSVSGSGHSSSFLQDGGNGDGVPSSTHLKVEKVIRCKMSPPFPLNQTLKGQAAGQVQDMVRGLMVAAMGLRNSMPGFNKRSSSSNTLSSSSGDSYQFGQSHGIDCYSDEDDDEDALADAK